VNARITRCMYVLHVVCIDPAVASRLLAGMGAGIVHVDE